MLHDKHRQCFNPNSTSPFNLGFTYTPCEGAIIDTLNIYNYQFLFDDIFGNILYDFMNNTKFPVAMDEIIPFKNMIQDSFETEIEKIYSSLNENSTERNTISHLISTYHSIYNSNNTVGSLITKSNSMLKYVRDLIKDSFNNFYENLFDDKESPSQNESGSENNYVNLYWQKIKSNYNTIKNVAKKSFGNETFFWLQNASEIWNSGTLGEIYSYDNEPGNESQHNDTIFGWLTDQIGRETKKFMDFVQPYTNISMYF